MRSHLQETLQRIAERAASSVVARGRLEPSGLSQALLRRLSSPPGDQDALLADPVFEMARVWKPADRTFGELEGNLLHSDLVAALDDAPSERMPRDRHPYAHQVEAWRAAANGKSCIVTSGTGSGKTECFMVPMLDDLAREAAEGPLVGVRAIVIYPLNALIESQRERLAAWTEGLKGRVRFGLYNGLTPETKREIQGPLAGAEIGDRRSIREAPPPILVTNVTMLEYLLLRAQDRSILERSRGALRWIVLDEAHGFIGAQAAEMALLLRRVRAAFGVRPEQVRLMATSATISEGPKTREKLGRFVSDLAGVDEASVAVIEGTPVEPDLPRVVDNGQLNLADLRDASPDKLWTALAPDPRVRAARQRLLEGPARLGDLAALLAPKEDIDDAEAQAWLDLAAQAQHPTTLHRLVPWRAHVLHRAQGGYWVCVDPNCVYRDPELRDEGTQWGFGALWLRQRDRCGLDCGAPVFELFACSECGTVHLLAGIEHGVMSRLVPRHLADFDDFGVDHEPDPDDDKEDDVITRDRVWLRPGFGEAGTCHLRVEDGVMFENGPPVEGRSVLLRVIDNAQDPTCCGRAAESPLRPQRYGPAFLMGSAIPMLLEDLAQPGEKAGLPMGGRRTITFSDSRQGTARLAARLQQEAERHLTRAFLYHSVQRNTGPTPERLCEIEQKLALFAAHPDVFADDIAVLEAERAGASKPISWPDLVDGLARHPELKTFATEVWRGRGWRGNELADDPALLAGMFLYRELFRRPRVQNNAETMGLVRLMFPDLDHRARASVPEALREAGVDADGWAGLAQAAVDLGLRENLAVKVKPEWLFHWASPRGSANNAMVASGTPPHERPSKSRPWPLANPGPFVMARLVRLVYRMIDGDPESAIDQDRAREVLDALWSLITSTACSSAGQGAWQLDFEKAAVLRVEDGWLCPVTRRVLGYATGGPSPYGTEDHRLLERLSMPRLPEADPAQPPRDARDRIGVWTRTDPVVSDLRARGLWSDLHDRIATFDPFLLAQEHSAQIERPVLKTYEDRFKRGEINILNCSTTMEMGVDIPDISMVINANLPPSISNYRQRVGRAGRRGEPWAFGVTFCRDLPLDWSAYERPESFLTAKIAAPAVRLDSAPIVARHVNAGLLAIFLRSLVDFKIMGSAGAFFGAQEDPAVPIAADAPADAFLAALRGDLPSDPQVVADLCRLVQGTALQGRLTAALCFETAEAFEAMLRRWRREYVELATAAGSAIEKEVRQSYQLRAKRMAGEFLIGELARRGFTPAYGFPVDVVSFDHLSGKPGSPDERHVLTFGERRGGASRTLDVAIREYAPGCEIVLDGLVHASEGVQPAWAAMADVSGLEDLQDIWECGQCRSFGMVRRDLDACPHCEAPAPRITKMLRPAGFLGRRVPHTGYERLARVPFEAPKVSAAGGSWLALADQRAGRVRGNPVGTVVSIGSGSSGKGFALCLCCGRAVSESDDTPGAPIPEAIRKHKPLAPPRGATLIDGHCPGGYRQPNRIQRHLRLGHEAHTDVFEYQTPAGTGREAAFGFAAALREALSDRLGVEAREIGLSTAASVGPSGEVRVSALLFDRASGGAGLVTRLAEGDWLEAAVSDASKKLDCPEQCASGCPACVLRPDINSGDAKIDRPAALDLARAISARLRLPEELRLFGLDTRLVGTSLIAHLEARRSRGQITALQLFLPSEPSRWDLGGWRIEDVLARMAADGVKIEIAIPTAALDDASFDPARRLDLYRIAARGSAQLLRMNIPPRSPGGAPVISSIATPGGSVGFAAADEAFGLPGSDWAAGTTAPIVMGPFDLASEGETIDANTLLAGAARGNSHLVWMRGEADGPVTGFGKRFWRKIDKEAPDVVKRIETERVVEAVYTDRYLQTPITIALLAEVLSATPGAASGCAVRVRTAQNDGAGRTAWAVFHNFQADGVRRAVIAAATAATDVEVLRRQEVPHARSLELRLASGCLMRILLDQGLGAWRVADPVRHDFDATPERQAAAISRMVAKIKMDHQDGSPIIIEPG